MSSEISPSNRPVTHKSNKFNCNEMSRLHNARFFPVITVFKIEKPLGVSFLNERNCGNFAKFIVLYGKNMRVINRCMRCVKKFLCDHLNHVSGYAKLVYAPVSPS